MSMNTFHLQIVTPDGQLYDGPAAALLASGCVETAFGVRPRPGGVRFERA